MLIHNFIFIEILGFLNLINTVLEKNKAHRIIVIIHHANQLAAGESYIDMSFNELISCEMQPCFFHIIHMEMLPLKNQHGKN